MPNATLNIVVQEKGSREAADDFRSMAKEIKDAGKALSALKRHLKGLGKGSSSAGTGAVNQINKEIDALNKSAAMRAKRVDAVMREEDRIRAAKQKTVDKLIKEFAREDAAHAKQVNATMRKEARIRAAQRATVDKVIRELTREEAAEAKASREILRQEEAKIRHRRRASRAMRRTVDNLIKEFAREDAAIRRTARSHRVAARAANVHAGSLRKVSLVSKIAHSDLVNLSNQVFFLQRAFITLGGAFVVGKYVDATNQFQNMENRLRLVTDGVDDLGSTFKELQGIADETRQELGSTVEAFVRIRKATQEHGASASQVKTTVTTLNKLLAISGQTSQEASQSIFQLSQAFAKGKLDGDEFRTISEAMPDILDLIAQSTGVARKELFKMSKGGKLTADVLLEAFDAGKEFVDAKFEQRIETLSGAWTVLKNQVVVTIGEWNKASGAAKTISDAILTVSQNMDILVIATKAVVYWIGVKLTAALVTAAVAGFSKLIDSLIVVQVAFYALRKGVKVAVSALASGVATVGRLVTGLLAATGPLGAIAVGLGVAYAAATLFSDSMERAANAIAGIKEEDLATSKAEALELALKKNEKLIRQNKSLLEQEKNGTQLFIRKEEILADIAKREKEIKLIKSQQAELETPEKKEAAEKAREKEIRDLEKLYQGYSKLKKELFPVAAATEEYRGKVELLWQAHKELDVSLFDTISAITFLTGEFLKAADPVGEYSRELDNQITLEKSSIAVKRRLAAEAKVAAFAEKQKAEGLKLTADQIAELTEKEIRLARLRERKTKKNKEVETEAKAYQSLQDSLDKTRAARREYSEQVRLLDKVLGDSADTAERKRAIVQALRSEYESSFEPIEAMNEQLTQELELSRLSADARERGLALMEKEKEIRDALGPIGVQESGTDPAAEAARQLAIIEETEANTKRADSIREYREELRKTANSQNEYKLRLEAIKDEMGEASNSVEGHAAKLEALKKAYPELADSIDKISGGTGKAAKAQAEYNRHMEALNLMWATKNGIKNFDEWVQKANELHAAYKKATKEQSGFQQGLDQLQEQFFSQKAMNDQIASSMVNAYSGVENALTGLVTTGKFEFKNMVDSMLADLTRLMIRMAIMKAMEEGGPGAGAMGGVGAAAGIGLGSFLIPALAKGLGFRHGGSFTVTRGLPHFAHGGEFQVGGKGGPDTKLVQFMASPGENVKVTNPGQSKLDNQNAQSQQAAPVVNIQNITDPSQLAAGLSSPAGERAIVNTIQQNAGLIKKYMR